MLIILERKSLHGQTNQDILIASKGSNVAYLEKKISLWLNYGIYKY
jgi:hypothetical protein